MSTFASNSSRGLEPTAIAASSAHGSSLAPFRNANLKPQSAGNQDTSSFPAGKSKAQQASDGEGTDGQGTDAETYFGDGPIEPVKDNCFSYHADDYTRCLPEADSHYYNTSLTASTPGASGSNPGSAVQGSQVPSSPSRGPPPDQVAQTAISRGRRLTRE